MSPRTRKKAAEEKAHEIQDEALPPAERVEAVVVSEAASTDAAPDLDVVVQVVNDAFARNMLAAAVEIGTYLVKTFFGGSYENFLKNKGNTVSFRKLAEREDLYPSFSWLNKAVRVTEQVELLPKDLRECLPLSHHVQLLLVKDPEEKARLARMADDEGWSVKRLAAEVKALLERESGGIRRGRPPFPAFVHGLNLLLKGVEQAARSTISDHDFEQYSPEDAQALLEKVQASLEVLQDVQSRVAQAISEFDGKIPEIAEGREQSRKRGKP